MEFRDPMKVERRVQPSPEPTDETHRLSGVETEHCCRNINKYMHTLRYLIIRAISCPMPGLPSSTPVLGDKSLLELVVATATVILGVLLAGSSQHKADYICALCILLCTRYNVLACVFKVSRERVLFWHKIIGITATISIGFSVSAQGYAPTGLAILACMCIAAAAYLIKNICFEVFYYVHIGCYLAIIPLVILHSNTRYFVYASAFWIFDLAVRYAFTRNKAVLRATILPGGVIQVQMQKCFSYRAGQYCFLCFPDVSHIQYHPFAFSSAPHEEEVTIHIREVGDWTKRLGNLIRHRVGSEQGTAVEIEVFIEGPYGEPQIDIHSSEYKVLVLICGGIGVTPLQSVYRDLVHQVDRGRQLRKVVFIWSAKDVADGQMIPNDIHMMPSSLQPPLYPHAYQAKLTGADIEGGCQAYDPTLQQIASDVQFFNEYYLSSPRERSKFESANIRPATQKWLKFGRPNLPAIFTEVAEMCELEKIARVGVMVCGPPGMRSTVQDICSTTLHQMICNRKEKIVKFDYHSESFCW